MVFLWYIGVLNNQEARTFKIPLNFLGNGNFKITQWADGETAATEPTDLKKTTLLVDASGTLKIELAPNGGFAAAIR